jgi:hypothetical protein
MESPEDNFGNYRFGWAGAWATSAASVLAARRVSIAAGWMAGCLDHELGVGD